MTWDEPASLGSRYFGPIPLSAILGRAGPLWIFEKEWPCSPFVIRVLSLQSIQSRIRPRPGQVPIRRRAQWRLGAISRPAALSGALTRKAASTAVCVFVVRTTLQVSAECMPVGLLTLITACALTVEPKSLPSDPDPREVGRMRVGLGSLSTDPRSLTAAMLRRASISPLRPDRLRSSASAAGRLRASRLIRFIARSRLIVAGGNGPTPYSQTPSGDDREGCRAELRHAARRLFRFRRYRAQRADA
jgi:hypothetical protein